MLVIGSRRDTAFDESSVTIVTGLPRSGTSMMMRMLEAGGLPVLVDGRRGADIDNPNGYYEFEPVKETRTDASWVEGARGRAVKMVYRLLYDVPAEFRYRVLFMRRDLGEILASQRKMLTRHGADPGVATTASPNTTHATFVVSKTGRLASRTWR